MLESYTLNELIKEVHNRCHCCVVCAIEKDEITDEPADGYVFAYNGDPFYCIGLVAHAQHVMNADLASDSDGHFESDDESEDYYPFSNN